MTRTLLIPSLFLLATVATAAPVDAAPAWVDSPSKFIPLNCSSTGFVDGIETWAGWVNDTAAPLKTGDSGYVHATAKNVGACNDGVTMELLLPAGATLDTSRQMYCIRAKAGTTQVDPIQNCAPWGFIGPNGGLMFTSGAVTLAPAWYLEIQVPVIYNAELLGTAGGTNHLLGVKTMNLQTSMLPSVPVTVGYRAKLENPTTSGVTTNSATVALHLVSFFKAGQFSIEYGTTSALGQSTIPASVANTYLYYTGTGATLSNLASSTTYYWRGRYVTSSGTFYSAMQTFATGYAAPVTLTVAKAGRGLGKVTSNPAGIDCGSYSANACSITVGTGTSVTLTATPSTGVYVFAGWSGACTGVGACTVPMTAASSVTATFEYYDFSTATPLPDPRPRRL